MDAIEDAHRSNPQSRPREKVFGVSNTVSQVGHERESNRFCKRASKGASQRGQAKVPHKEGTQDQLDCLKHRGVYQGCEMPDTHKPGNEGSRTAFAERGRKGASPKGHARGVYR